MQGAKYPIVYTLNIAYNAYLIRKFSETITNVYSIYLKQIQIDRWLEGEHGYK